jgi:hypothetical protein
VTRPSEAARKAVLKVLEKVELLRRRRLQATGFSKKT